MQRLSIRGGKIESGRFCTISIAVYTRTLKKVFKFPNISGEIIGFQGFYRFRADPDDGAAHLPIQLFQKQRGEENDILTYFPQCRKLYPGDIETVEQIFTKLPFPQH